MTRGITAYSRLLMATLAWGVLAFGAVYPWAYWPLAVAATGLGVWGIIATRAWEDPRARSLALALAAIAAAIGLQLVSLPYAWLDTLSPAVDGFLRRLHIFYHPASLHPLSIDPTETAIALGLFLALALFLVGLVRAIRYLRLEWLVNQLLGFSIALAVFGVIQKAFGPSDHLRVYGFWTPFINRNHFAGWMVMILPLVLGYAAALVQRVPHPRLTDLPGWLRWTSTEDAGRPILAIICVLVMAMSIVLTGSRSGMASFAAVLVVFAAFVTYRLSSRRAGVLVAASFATLLAGAVAWSGAASAATRFENAGSELSGRTDAWRDTARIIQDFPVFGTGLGTYGEAMLIYQRAGRDEIYLQAHNDYLQLAAEGGALVVIPAIILVVMIALVVRHRFRTGDDDPLTHWLRVGAVAGLVGIAAQSVVEFSLQMPGNTATCALLLALAMHRPRRRREGGHAHRV
jgi:O-antigen ligase